MSKSIGSLSLERRVDALFARYTAAGSPLVSPGAVVGVMRGGAIELCKGYGLASIELGVPIRPHTRFRIASVSKQFTVTAALMLAAEGKLKLGDPPHKYLPELSPLPVTIDQMMRNCSGLPDFLELLRLGGHGLDKPARPADLLAACLRNRHLNFTPGSRFLYSNTNSSIQIYLFNALNNPAASRQLLVNVISCYLLWVLVCHYLIKYNFLSDKIRFFIL